MSKAEEGGRIRWKPGNMLYPLPAVLVSCRDLAGNTNLITLAWAGTVCSDPPMVSVSIRPERHSFGMILETKEFVINLTTEEMAFATDYCGVVSGRNVDKWKATKLTPVPSAEVSAPAVKESPVNLECRVTEVKHLGTHDMFIARVVAVQVSDRYMDEKGKFHLDDARPIVYCHGNYFGLGDRLGGFGYSVRKK